MAEESKKIQLETVVDASGAEQGFAKVEAGAKNMAQAVGQAGQTAGKAIDGIGNGGAAAAGKVESAAKSMIGAIQRTTALMEAGERGSVKYYEALANQRGIPLDVLKPYLAQLDAVSAKQSQATGVLNAGAAGLENVGMSARATAAALRQVPAQFTDIITSLQGGQKPLTVLLQQGGQLKDVFGGVGPAAKALGGYVLGLISPLTLLAGAVGLTAFAAIEGAKELKEFQNAATITGNAMGISASQFSALRESIGGIGATKGKAAEVLTEIADKGVLAGGAIKSIAEAAILMEKATGQATAKTIEQFAELAKAPADASAKLNEQYNYLTASVYKQIKALEEQGRQFQAANLAEETYASAIKARSQTVIDNAGLLEKAWRGVTGAAKSAWDTMLGIGRQETIADKAQVLRDRIEANLRERSMTGAAGREGIDKGIAKLREQLNLLTESERMEKRVSESKAEQSRLQQLGIAFEKQGDEFKTKAQRREEELLKAKTQGQELVKAGIITEIELNQRLSGIRQKYNETTGQSEVAGIDAKIIEKTALLNRLREANQSPDGAAKVREQTEGEKLAVKIQEELKTGIMGVARAEKERALAAAQRLAQLDVETEKELRKEKALAASRAALEGQIDAMHKSADSIRDQAIGQEAVNANMGKGKTAIEQATLAQLKLNAAEAEDSLRFAPAYIAAVNAKVAAQERFVKALQEAEYQQAKTKLTESGRVSAEESETLKLEFSLLGQTQQVRERVIAQRKAEVKLAKELAEIEKLNLGQGPEADAQREKLRAEARANAVVDANNAAAKVVLAEWEKTADSINNSITDALLKGFESGKSFAAGLRDTIVGMFKNMVLRPIIQAQLAPVSGALSSLVGSVTGNSGISSISGFPGTGNLLSGIGDKLGITGPGSITDVVGGILGGGSGISGITASGAEIAGTVASTSEALAGMGASAAEATAAAEALGSTMATTSGALGGIGSALAAIPGWGWAALGATALLGLSGGGEKRIGGQYNMNGLISSPSGGDIGGGAGTKATISNINKTLKDLGSTQQLIEFFSGAEQSKNGKGFAYAGGVLTGSTIFGQGQDGQGYNNRRGSKTTEQATAELADELKQAYLQALQASDIKGAVADYIKGLGNIDAIGTEGLDKAIGNINAGMTLQNQLLELQSTATENLARARQKELDALDPAFQTLQKQVYAEQDLQKNKALEAQLLELQSTASENLARARQTELDTLNESQRVIVQKIYAEQDLQKNKALEAQLLELQSTSTENLARSRQTELDALNDSQRVIAQKIYAEQDLQKRQAIEGRLLELQSTDAQNLARARTAELAAMDPAFRALQQQVYIQEDLKKATEATNKILLDNVKSAADQLKAARTAERDELKSSIKALQDWAKSLRTFRDSLLTGDQSPLTPAQKLAEARRQLDETAALARGGDTEAQGKLQGVATAFLTASQTFNASSAGYQADFAYTQNLLTDLANHSLASADVAKLQLDAQNAQLAAMGVLNDSTLTSAERIAAAIANLSSSVLMALNAGINPGAQNLGALTNGVTGQGVTTGAGQVYADAQGASAIGVGGGNYRIYTLDGRVLSAAEARDQIKQAIDLGGTSEYFKQISTVTGVSRESMLALLWNTGYQSRLPSFANGGDHAGGWAMVGERGPELAYMPPARIYNARDTSAMVGGGADVAEEIRLLRAEVISLRELTGQGHFMIADVTARAGEAVSGAVKGTASQTAHAMKLRQKAELV